MSERGDLWLREVEDFVVEAVGPRVSLEIIRERAWGVIVRVRTPDRVLFFKEPAFAGRHESVIVDDLSKGWPGLAPDVVAAEHERGWLLMEHHGKPMRGVVAPEEQIAVFEEVLPRYAQMQRESAPFADRWMKAGAPDRRVERLPGLVEELVGGRTRIGAIPLTSDQRAAIDASLGDLTASPLHIAGIDHSDMHDNNVLIGRGSPRVIDWGDSCISHPFASLYVIFQHAVARSPESGRRDAALRLRDAYLEPWSEDATGAELRESFAYATWLGYVIRALNFVHMMGEADFDQCRDDVAQFLTRWSDKRLLLHDPDALVAAVADQTEYET
jgi:hypothetical protein